MKKELLINDKFQTIVFGAIVYVFFAILYPFHLNYMEQYQMFMFSGDYLHQYLIKPGGISDYLGNFLTQFFFYSWCGAIIISLMLILLQQLVWFIAKKQGVDTIFTPISFIPSALYWAYLCNENWLMGGLVSLIIISACISIYGLLKSQNTRNIYVWTLIPVLYWFCGGVSVILPLFAIISELTKGETNKIHISAQGTGWILFSIILPLLTKNYIVQLPLVRAWIGVNFFRFPGESPIEFGMAGLLILGIPFILRYLSKSINKKLRFLLLIEFVIMIAGISFLIRSNADMAKEEVMTYDFNVRMRRWDRVISMADKKTPMNPISVSCLNLALAKQDLLGERMFNYYQNGVEGLIPAFKRDFTLPMIVGEIYYHLGMINTAQRYAFEAMEALPDYQKSVRAIMRLSETNLINGNYKVAEKYLHLLQTTFYYRHWATKALATMQDENLIEQHSEWGLLRQYRTKEDFLFSENEKDMMLGIMFQQNNKNRMAFEYLMAYCMLKKDIQHFWQYFPMCKSINYNQIPMHYQEALHYIWSMHNNATPENNPYAISNIVKQRMQSFSNAYNTSGGSETLLKNSFSDTYWYYLQF